MTGCSRDTLVAVNYSGGPIDVLEGSRVIWVKICAEVTKGTKGDLG